jgi:hypothetical protein
MNIPTHCPPKHPLCPDCLKEVARRQRISRMQTTNQRHHVVDGNKMVDKDGMRA